MKRPYGRAPYWRLWRVVTPGTSTAPLIFPRVGCSITFVDMIESGWEMEKLDGGAEFLEAVRGGSFPMRGSAGCRQAPFI